MGNRSNPSSKRTRQRISILYEEHVAAGENDASSRGDPVQDKKKTDWKHRNNHPNTNLIILEEKIIEKTNKVADLLEG